MKKEFHFNHLKKLSESKDFKNYKFVYIYSDFRFLLSKNKKNIEQFMSFFLNIFLKNKQTIIVPSFTYSKKKFNIKTEKSKVGFLSNYLLSLKGIARSEHPIFSYVAFGANNKIVKKIGKSAFGINSVHQKLLFNKCCVLHIGRELIEGNTVVHHIEQLLKANYRYEKVFNTKVYNNKKYCGANYSAYVRKNFNQSSLFSFKKVVKKIKSQNLIIKLSNYKNLRSLFYYSYDDMYLFLINLYINDNKIFLRNN